MASESYQDCVQRVMAFKRKLTMDPLPDISKIIKILHKLNEIDIDVQILQETGIGKVVNSLRKVGEEVSELAKPLIQRWKNMVRVAMVSEISGHSTSSTTPKPDQLKRKREDHSDNDGQNKPIKIKIEPGEKIKKDVDKISDDYRKIKCSKFEQDVHIKQEPKNDGYYEMAVRVKEEKPDTSYDEDIADHRNMKIVSEVNLSSLPKSCKLWSSYKTEFPPYVPKSNTNRSSDEQSPGVETGNQVIVKSEGALLDDINQTDSFRKAASGSPSSSKHSTFKTKKKDPDSGHKSENKVCHESQGDSQKQLFKLTSVLHTYSKPRKFKIPKCSPDNTISPPKTSDVHPKEQRKSTLFESIVQKVISSSHADEKCKDRHESNKHDNTDPDGRSRTVDLGISRNKLSETKQEGTSDNENPVDLIPEMNSFNDILKQIKLTSTTRERTAIKPQKLLKRASPDEKPVVQSKEPVFTERDEREHRRKVEENDIKQPKIKSYPKIASKPRKEVFDSLDLLFVPDHGIKEEPKTPPKKMSPKSRQHSLQGSLASRKALDTSVPESKETAAPLKYQQHSDTTRPTSNHLIDRKSHSSKFRENNEGKHEGDKHGHRRQDQNHKDDGQSPEKTGSKGHSYSSPSRVHQNSSLDCVQQKSRKGHAQNSRKEHEQSRKDVKPRSNSKNHHSQRKDHHSHSNDHHSNRKSNYSHVENGEDQGRREDSKCYHARDPECNSITDYDHKTLKKSKNHHKKTHSEHKYTKQKHKTTETDTKLEKSYPNKDSENRKSSKSSAMSMSESVSDSITESPIYEKNPVGIEKSEPSSNFLAIDSVSSKNLKLQHSSTVKSSKGKKGKSEDILSAFEDSLFGAAPTKKVKKEPSENQDLKAEKGKKDPVKGSSERNKTSSKSKNQSPEKTKKTFNKGNKLEKFKDRLKMDFKEHPKFEASVAADEDVLKLPSITPDYKPLPEIISPDRKKAQADTIPLQWFGSKSNRTKVFSGKIRVNYWSSCPSLQDVCKEVIFDNIDSLEDVGGVPFYILESVLTRCSAQQLLKIEDFNPDFILESDYLWKVHVAKTFKNVQRQDMESWREVYLRMIDEREYKLLTVTANITRLMAKKDPGRLTKLAYLDKPAKPPRNVRRQQMKHGISNYNSPSKKIDRGIVFQPVRSSHQPASSTSRPSHSSGYSRAVEDSPIYIPDRGPRGVKVIAPMMKQSLKLMNKIKKRR